jgi:hypothetical protein
MHMNVSEIFTVEYNPKQREWRIITLDEVLKANYQDFLNIAQGTPARPILEREQPDWILLGVGSSKEEAEALIVKLEKIKDEFIQELHAVRQSDTAKG